MALNILYSFCDKRTVVMASLLHSFPALFLCSGWRVEVKLNGVTQPDCVSEKATSPPDVPVRLLNVTGDDICHTALEKPEAV